MKKNTFFRVTHGCKSNVMSLTFHFRLLILKIIIIFVVFLKMTFTCIKYFFRNITTKRKGQLCMYSYPPLDVTINL